MTLAQMIAAQRATIATQLEARAALTTTLEEIRSSLPTSGVVTPEVTERITTTLAERTALDAEIDTANARLRELEAEEARAAEIDALQRDIGPGAGRPAYDRVARVGAEERTYRPDTDPSGAQFIRDLGASFLYPHDRASRDRLERHDREARVEYATHMERAAGTGAFAGLTVPQYLTALYAPATANGRGIADAMTQLPLPPDGMVVNLSRVTTATSAALQASENTSVSSTDIDDTLLSINVQTAAGQQTLSRQAIDRGTGTEAVVLSDLFRRYNAVLDSTIINQATTGLTNVATVNAYTDASPTVAELYPKFLQSQAAVEAALVDQATGDNVIAMHSRRWYWLQNAITNTWPSMGQGGINTQNIGINYAERYGAGFRGLLPNGAPVVVDNNIGTTLGGGTEDEAFCFDAGQSFLWEDPGAPMFIRAEQPAAASLGVLFVTWGYFAYTFQRYTQAQKISGTGMAAPTFTGV